MIHNPLRTFQLVAGATGAMLTDKVIYVISHDDDHDQCAVSYRGKGGGGGERGTKCASSKWEWMFQSRMKKGVGDNSTTSIYSSPSQ